MKYAKIVDGAVAQVQPNNELGFIEAPDDVVCGMLYDNATNTFTNPPAQPDTIPSEVTMRQARKALIQTGQFTAINNAIMGSGDEVMIMEWEYSTTVRRDWPSLISLAGSLGMTDTDLDNLFTLAATL